MKHIFSIEYTHIYKSENHGKVLRFQAILKWPELTLVDRLFSVVVKTHVLRVDSTNIRWRKIGVLYWIVAKYFDSMMKKPKVDYFLSYHFLVFSGYFVASIALLW